MIQHNGTKIFNWKKGKAFGNLGWILVVWNNMNQIRIDQLSSSPTQLWDLEKSKTFLVGPEPAASGAAHTMIQGQLLGNRRHNLAHKPVFDKSGASSNTTSSSVQLLMWPRSKMGDIFDFMVARLFIRLWLNLVRKYMEWSFWIFILFY